MKGKNIYLTEKQISYIKENVGNMENEEPQNTYGTQVFSNGPEGLPHTTDKISQERQRKGFFGQDKSVAGTTTYKQITPKNIDERDRSLDNTKSFGLGKKNNEKISQIASNGGGKMVTNISNEINNKEGIRNNTNQVRVSRLEKQKKENPSLYAQNGGDATVKALKNDIRKNSETNKSEKSTENSINISKLPTPNVNKGQNKGHHTKNETLYYFS